MAKFKKGDKIVRRANKLGGVWGASVTLPAEKKIVEMCEEHCVVIRDVERMWDPSFFILCPEPQPEPVNVTEPTVQQIPGVPDGYRLVRIGVPKKDEAYVNSSVRAVVALADFSDGGYAIVEPIVPPAPPTPIPTTVKVQLNRYLVGDLIRPSSLRVVECTQENIDSCYFEYRLLGPSETLELEVEV